MEINIECSECGESEDFLYLDILDYSDRNNFLELHCNKCHNRIIIKRVYNEKI